MAPSADHRLRFREYDKEPPLFWFSKLVLVGSTSLAAATAPAVFPVTDSLVDQSWAALLAALVAGWVVSVWPVTPLWQRGGRRSRAGGSEK